MNRTNWSKIGFVSGLALLGVLTGFKTYGQPSVSEQVSVGLPSVEIHAESDFYEPLTPYGRWEVVGSYGRCWIPGRVEAEWRPYCEGYWQRTEAGWYWASDEPWAWATYHYGRWDRSPQFGWYWVPQTQWAPAWVSWHSGGGYIGWAPMYPSGVSVISPRAYVFVEERHFMEPIRRSTVVVNNTTIINKTVIKEAPTTALVEKASGRTVQMVAVRDLRQKEEAGVAGRQKTTATIAEKRAGLPIRSEAGTGEKKAIVAPAASRVEKSSVTPRGPAPLAPTGRVVEQAPPQVEKPASTAHEPATPAPKHLNSQSEIRKPVPAANEIKPGAKPEGNHAAPTREPAGQKANPPAQKQEKPAPIEKNKPNTTDQNHENKSKE
jgi:hypothetical protein